MVDVFRIEMLPASDGDCLWVEWGDDQRGLHRMLIDGGRAGAAAPPALLARLARASDRRFEVVVGTHIDDDHITGLIPLLAAPPAGFEVGDVWFNSLAHLPTPDKDDRLGTPAADRLAKVLDTGPFPWNSNAIWTGKPRGAVVRDPVDRIPVVDVGGLQISLLSPTITELEKLRSEWPAVLRQEGLDDAATPVLSGDVLGYTKDQGVSIAELQRRPLGSDPSKPNASSIAFVAEYAGRRVLFGADGRADVLLDGLRRWQPTGPIEFAAVKMAHHGSEKNLSQALLQAISCRDWLVSTNGSKHHHPDRRALAHLVAGSQPRRLLFNYYGKMTQEWGLSSVQQKWGFTAVLPDDGDPGLTYDVLAGAVKTGGFPPV